MQERPDGDDDLHSVISSSVKSPDGLDYDNSHESIQQLQEDVNKTYSKAKRDLDNEADISLEKSMDFGSRVAELNKGFKDFRGSVGTYRKKLKEVHEAEAADLKQALKAGTAKAIREQFEDVLPEDHAEDKDNEHIELDKLIASDEEAKHSAASHEDHAEPSSWDTDDLLSSSESGSESSDTENSTVSSKSAHNDDDSDVSAVSDASDFSTGNISDVSISDSDLSDFSDGSDSYDVSGVSSNSELSTAKDTDSASLVQERPDDDLPLIPQVPVGSPAAVLLRQRAQGVMIGDDTAAALRGQNVPTALAELRPRRKQDPIKEELAQATEDIKPEETPDEDDVPEELKYLTYRGVGKAVNNKAAKIYKKVTNEAEDSAIKALRRSSKYGRKLDELKRGIEELHTSTRNYKSRVQRTLSEQTDNMNDELKAAEVWDESASGATFPWEHGLPNRTEPYAKYGLVDHSSGDTTNRQSGEAAQASAAGSARSGIPVPGPEGGVDGVGAAAGTDGSLLEVAAALGDLAGSVSSKRVDATSQRLRDLQEQQEKVMRKLEEAVNAGQLEALNEASGGRLAAQLASHINSLKAEQEIIRALVFPEYGNVKKFGQQVRERSNDIQQVLTKMTDGGIISDMLGASDKYKEIFKQMVEETMKFKAHVPKMERQIAKEKAGEINDIVDTHLRGAFTLRDEQMIKDETPEQRKLIHEGVIPREDVIKNADMGNDPYEDLSMYKPMPKERPHLPVSTGTDTSSKDIKEKKVVEEASDAESRDEPEVPTTTTVKANFVINVPAFDSSSVLQDHGHDAILRHEAATKQ